MAGAHRNVEIPFSSAPPGTCRWCGEEILKDGVVNRRRRWHPKCGEDFKIAAWPAWTRSALLERDGGVCAGCGTATLGDYLGAEAAYREALAIWEAAKPKGYGTSAHLWSDECFEHARKRPRGPTSSGVWEADHIVPLVDGGGFGLDNLQTLCVACHKRKTAREAAERAGKAPAVDQLPIL